MHNKKVVKLIDFYFPVESKDYFWSHIVKGSKIEKTERGGQE